MMSEISSSEKPEFCLPTRRGSSTFWVAKGREKYQKTGSPSHTMWQSDGQARSIRQNWTDLG